MVSTWLLWLAFLVYPILIIKLNLIIKHKIQDISKRKAFKKQNEYVIKLIYLITPLLLFHVELWYLNAGYTFYDLNTLSLSFLIFLQVFLLLFAIYSLQKMITGIKKCDVEIN
jgi:hypothetical protein